MRREFDQKSIEKELIFPEDISNMSLSIENEQGLLTLTRVALIYRVSPIYTGI